MLVVDIGIVDGVGMADVGRIFTSVGVAIGVTLADDEIVGVDSGTDEFEGGTIGTNFHGFA